MARLLSRAGRLLKLLVIVGVVAGGLLQLVPYGWQHSNPPVTGTPPWPSAEVERLARASCYDCHSNESEWPWYSYVAPMSWLVRNDVDRGREALNFSAWGRGEDEAHHAAEEVERRSMPPDRYLRLHPGARLSAAERQALAAALKVMDGDGGGGRGRGGGDEEGGDSGTGGSGTGGGGNSGPGGGDD